MTRFTRMRVSRFVLLSGLLVAMSVQAEPVNLTVLLPLSGVYKVPGTSAKQGFLMGLQAEATTHNIDWESWITLTFLDTRFDKARSLQLAKDAIAGGAKAILGCTSSGVGVHIRDYVLDEAAVPFIVFGGCVAAKLRTKHSLFIRLSYSQPTLSVALARWLIEHPIVPGDKPRWACIHADYVWGVGICDGFKRAYRQVGEEIGRVPVPLKTLNKEKEIVQLEKLNPDFVVAAFPGADAGAFVKDYYRLEVHQKIPVVALGSPVTPKQLRAYEKTLAAQGTGVGLVTVTPYSAMGDNPANQRFVALYQQTYNTRPSAFAMWGYDGGRLLIKALVKLQGQWDGPQVVQLMKTLPLMSPRYGDSLRFDTYGNAISPASILKTKRDGSRLFIETVGQVPPINLDDYQ